MNLSRAAFLCLAASLLAYAVLFSWANQGQNAYLIGSKTLWAAVVGALFFAFAAWRLSKKAQTIILAVVVSVGATEALLEAAGWLGVLPAVITKEKAPFARVYWTAEGRGNSVRNCFGWHSPEFDLQAPKRIAVIGDSFVEAVEVGRNRNHAVILQQLLRERAPGWAVLGLGTHGTSPAFHLEVLDYAARHFAPQETIVFLYLGNDISESSPVLNYVPPEQYIYYDFAHAGQLALMPASAAYREKFINGLEQCHRSPWVHLPVIAKSHCMLVQSFLSVQAGVTRARRLRGLANADPTSAGIDDIGRNLKPFALRQSAETRHAMELTLAELGLMQQRCRQHGIKLRIVTIPFFPPQFYATQHGSQWTLRLGEHDFLAPDREIAAFARERDVSFLSLGDWLAAAKTEVDRIRSFYFLSGSGHFTERGHRMCAHAVFETFYSEAPK